MFFNFIYIQFKHDESHVPHDETSFILKYPVSQSHRPFTSILWSVDESHERHSVDKGPLQVLHE